MIPTSLITRATLDGVAQIYETSVLPTDPDTCVLWDALQIAGCEVLASEVDEVEAGSALHRWIVLDAIESAESVPQGTEGRAAIEAARTWVADPSEENRVAASAASSSAHAAARAAAYAAASAAYYAPYSAAAAAYAPYYAAAAAYYAATAPSESIADAAYSAAKLRFRVLTTMAQAGVLPEPSVE